MEKVGLIAGNRKFPLIVAEAIKRTGAKAIVVAIKGDTSGALKRYADKIYWIDLNEFSRLFEIFKAEGVLKVVMAGQITPTRLFNKGLTRDPLLKGMLQSLKDKKADTIFGAIAALLAERGLELMDSTQFVKEHMPSKGCLTTRAPGFDEWQDVYFGFDLAKEIALLDIGQTVAVKGKAIVAVEALEGTDNLIARAGLLSRGGFIVVKVSKPQQDLRFDVPVVGLRTVRSIISAGGRCLAFEADKTLFIDREKSVATANRKGLAIVAL